MLALQPLGFAPARSSDNLMDSCKGKAVINHGPEDLVFSPREFFEV